MALLTTRTLAVGLTATLMIGGVTAVASANGAPLADTHAAVPQQVVNDAVPGFIWCRDGAAGGAMRQVWSYTPCRPGETRSMVLVGSGSVGPEGPQGPAGPSNGYESSAASAELSGLFADVVSVAVPAGSYLLSFSGFGSGADGAGLLSCRMTASGPATWTAPTVTTWIANSVTDGVVAGVGPGTNPVVSMTGALTSAGAQTLTVQCRVGPGGVAAASMIASHVTALKVATLN